MADPQNSENPDTTRPASPAPQDYYAVLSKVIDDATRDHTQLRKLVYALAWQNLKPDAIITKPIAQALDQAKTILELEQAIQLERAIHRIEGEVISRELAPSLRAQPSAADATPAKAKPAAVVPTTGNPDPSVLAEPIAAPSIDPELPIRTPIDLDEELAVNLSGKSSPAQTGAERDLDIQAVDASFEPPRAGGALATFSEPKPRSERKDLVPVERIPPWLHPTGRGAVDTVEYAPIHRAPPAPGRSHFFTWFQVIAASAIGVVLYIGISG